LLKFTSVNLLDRRSLEENASIRNQ